MKPSYVKSCKFAHQEYIYIYVCVYIYIFLISNFRCVLNVVCCLLGNSPASEFCMATSRNSLSVPSS